MITYKSNVFSWSVVETKKFSSKKSKILCIIIILNISLLITLTFSLVKINKKPNIPITRNNLILIDNLKFEINSEVNLLSLISENNRSKIITDDYKIDTTTLGEKDITIKYNDKVEEKEETFKIVIVDTIIPNIECQKELITTTGTKIDLLQGVKVSDNSNEEIIATIEGNYDFNKEGTYLLKYVAIDSSGNKKEEDFTLKVSKKPTTEKPFITVTKEDIEKQTYYIPNNLERYLAYNNGTRTAKEIVTNVNCNIDKEFYTNINPADVSKGYLILVNKYYAVDKNYKPANLTQLGTNYSYRNDSYLATEAYDSYTQMIDDGRSLGYKLIDTSNFRTYNLQADLFNQSVKNNGMAYALKSSAKPGHSEHETGLASDIVKQGVSMYNFGSTAEFNWLKDNAYKYGFILRYPKGKVNETGYKYEPWHFRYVGKTLSSKLYNNGEWTTLESYFGITSKY